MAMSYWTNRVNANIRRAERLATTANKRYKDAGKAALKRIEADLDSLLLQIQMGLEPTRTQLWKAKRYMVLRQTIEREVEEYTNSQISITESVLKDVVAQTLGDVAQDFEYLDTSRIRVAIDSAWSGKDYSQRIWSNGSALAKHLQDDILDLIVLGKNPTDIKHKIMEDFQVSFRAADRLIRTESMFLYNEASKQVYAAAGVRELRYLHKADGGKCDCDQYDGQVFVIGTEPQLPRHPNCKCCYAPVIDLRK